MATTLHRSSLKECRFNHLNICGPGETQKKSTSIKEMLSRVDRSRVKSKDLNSAELSRDLAVVQNQISEGESNLGQNCSDVVTRNTNIDANSMGQLSTSISSISIPIRNETEGRLRAFQSDWSDERAYREVQQSNSDSFSTTDCL